MNLHYIFRAFATIIAVLFMSACGAQNSDYITLQSQGSFMVGGVVLQNKQGQTYRADHAYVFYQIPANAKTYPMIFAHGIEQSSKTWESTPDGRDGFANIFLREGYGVYLVTQPRRGNAGKSSVSVNLKPDFSDERWFNIFRIGVYPKYFDDVQFPRDSASLDQLLRQGTPTIAPKQDLELYADAYAKLFDKVGGGIFITHSQGGNVGWRVAQKTDNIKAIVAYEPGGGFPFPKGQLPNLGKALSLSGVTEGREISRDEFLRYTKFPIIIYYGDYLPKSEAKAEKIGFKLNYAWRVRLELAKEWANLINANGGDAQVVHLPEIGIKGNTHFPFADLNNAQIADLLKSWLKEKGLDR